MKDIHCKKIFLVGVLVVSSFVSCAKKHESYRNQKDVILVTEGSGIDDKSFNASAWRGITGYFGDTPEATSQRGIRYEELYSSSQDQIFHNLNIATDEHPRIVMGTGFTFAEPMQRVAKANPDQWYLLVDGDNGGLSNLRSVLFKEHEGGFLIGAMVALQAKVHGIKNPKFAFLGGMQGDVVTRFELGYIQGILSISPDAVIEDFYAGSWAAPELGKTKAKEWFNKGFYAVFSAAGGTGGGVIAEAKEQRLSGHNVWALGVDSDQHDDGIYGNNGQSAVLSSVLKFVDKAVCDVLTEAEDDNFIGKNVFYGIKEEGIDISLKNKELDRAVAIQVEKIKEQIKLGNVMVFSTYADAKNANLIPLGLTLS